MNARDVQWMREALALARRGRGRVSPNPCVAAVVVKNGRRIASGFHARFGGPHAEAAALARAGRAARGATLYVTLEPCTHWGKTPPCVDAVLASGVRRVVTASRDPNPLVSGRGIAALRAAKVRVEVGLLRREAERLNAPYFKWHRTGLPFVILKWAESADGRIARAGGRPATITSRAALRAAHRLRAFSDAVCVGIRTALADDPLLTVRRVAARRQPVRIVLDSRARLPLSSRLVRTASPHAPVWVVSARPLSAIRRRRLERADCRVITLPRRRHRGVSLMALARRLGRLGIQTLLVEGGSRVIESFARTGLVDQVVRWRSPRRIGPKGIPAPRLDRLMRWRWPLSGRFRDGPDERVEWSRFWKD